MVLSDYPPKIEPYSKKKKGGFQHKKVKVSSSSEKALADDVDSEIST